MIDDEDLLLVVLAELLAREETGEDTEDELGNTGTIEELAELGYSDELPREEADKDEASDLLLATALLANAELEGLASLAVPTLTLDTWVTLDDPWMGSEDAACDSAELCCWVPVFLPPLPPPQAVKVAASTKENNRRTREELEFTMMTSLLLIFVYMINATAISAHKYPVYQKPFPDDCQTLANTFS